MIKLITFRKYFVQIVASLSATLSMISDGMQVSWTGPLTPILLSENSPIQVCDGDIAWLEISYVLGGLFGIPLIYLVNKIGRKNLILLLNVLRLIGWTLIATTPSVQILILARILNGAAYYASTSILPSYVVEIADKSIRGTLGSLCALNLTTGYILINALIPALTISQSSLVGLSFVVITLSTFVFMPDSPTYFLYTNKYNKAKHALQRLRASEDVEEELFLLSVVVGNQKNSKISIIKILKEKNCRWALIILSVLTAVKCASGISPMLMNMNSLLISAKSSIPPYVVALISFCGMLVIGLSTITLLDKWGRKAVFISSAILSGTSMFLLAMLFVIQPDGISESLRWAPGVLILLFMFTYRYGIGTVPFVLVAELLPPNLKTLGMSVALMTFIFMTLFSITIYEVLVPISGFPLPLLIFSAFCFFGAVFTAVFVPETKQKTLEEIQILLKGENETYHSKTKYVLTETSNLIIDVNLNRNRFYNTTEESYSHSGAFC